MIVVLLVKFLVELGLVGRVTSKGALSVQEQYQNSNKNNKQLW
jgi:hypothetical protein